MKRTVGGSGIDSRLASATSIFFAISDRHVICYVDVVLAPSGATRTLRKAGFQEETGRQMSCEP
ncbi:TPA: hypothetical protein ACXEYS_005211, partial [Escherichia coli]